MRTPAIAGVAAAAALLAPVALAQAPAKPEPACNAVYSDKKGDTEEANLDLTGFWFDHTGGKTYANMRIADLTKDFPDGATGVAWYVLWTVGDTQNFVTAQYEVGQSDVEYAYGTVVVTGNSTRRTRAAEPVPEGQFVEGPDGVIRVEIPAEAGGIPGTAFKGVTADTKFTIGVPGVISSLQPADDAAGRNWTVADCRANSPAPAPPPAGGPAPAPQPSPGNTGREVAAGKLDVALAQRTPKARKVRRTLPLKLRSKKGARGIEAALYRGKISGGRIIARGRITKLTRKGTLRLKLTRKLAKGSYSLYLVGRNADGTEADKTLKLRFR